LKFEEISRWKQSTIRQQQAEGKSILVNRHPGRDSTALTGFDCSPQSEITDNKEYVLVMGFPKNRSSKTRRLPVRSRAKPFPGRKEPRCEVLNGKSSPALKKETNPDIDEFLK